MSALFVPPVFVQTGRLLRHFLYLGLNTDEATGTKVYDGLLPHIAG